MASPSSSTPSLTPSRSPSPPPIVQPDHFFGLDHVPLPPPGKSWLDPDDDPSCALGIPVFKPTMDEFRDFETFMNKVECWGKKSGIIKVIPPQEWTDSLPSLKPQLAKVKIKTPIEQHMQGRAGLFRQDNMEKHRNMSVREWFELCRKEDFRAPSVDEVLHIRHVNMQKQPSKRRKSTVPPKSEIPDVDMLPPREPSIKDEPMDQVMIVDDEDAPISKVERKTPAPFDTKAKDGDTTKPAKRTGPTRAEKDARLADRHAQDERFLGTFDPHTDWLPPNTTADDYTPEFCKELERRYWRNCGLGRPAWYGADTQGSLYTDETTSWNVAHLESTLSRLLAGQGLPGVNTPYLYWGMWRATFAWHVEDMDLFSINYIHFGAPKFWYAMPQARAKALEDTMRGYFPKDTSKCSQFLRHKSFLVSPNLLSTSYCKPNCCVQQAGEFIITYPRGYHAGFNLGINCAESVNFALDSWIELGRKAETCHCVSDSVRINVDQLLQEQGMMPFADPAAAPPEAMLGVEPPPHQPPSTSSSPNKRAITKVNKEPTILVPLPPTKPKSFPPKRKAPTAGAHGTGGQPQTKRAKVSFSSSSATHLSSSSAASSSSKSSAPKITLKIRSISSSEKTETYPCCLCISTSKEGLLRVYDPPYTRKDAVEAAGNPEIWMAHESCARIIPETWVDEIQVEAEEYSGGETGQTKERFVFGVDGIVKDRWNLKCAACVRARPKSHGAPIQCTKGKCSKSFHISCARDEPDIVFEITKEVEKEVLLVDPSVPSQTSSTSQQLLTAEDEKATVLKIIRKDEIKCLCSQHNPDVLRAKQASKQDKIRTQLLSLPHMSRIKIRVPSGLFEVSLLRVIEATSSVEVLWDRAQSREFKWGCVMFGKTDGVVLQKPSDFGGIAITPTTATTLFPSSLFPSPPLIPGPGGPSSSISLSHNPSSSSTTSPETTHLPPSGPVHYPNADYPASSGASELASSSTGGGGLTYSQFFNANTTDGEPHKPSGLGLNLTQEQVEEILQNNEELKNLKGVLMSLNQGKVVV